MKTWLFVITIVMFCLSFALAVAALGSSKPAAPVLPSCITSANGNVIVNPGVCRSYLEYGSALISYYRAIWTVPELSESFFAVALLCLGVSLLKAPMSFKKAVVPPASLKVALAFVAAFGTVLFMLLEVADFNFVDSFGLGSLRLFGFWLLGFQTPAYAIAGLGVATLCVGLLAVGKGFSIALKSAVLFGSFWVLVAQTCLYLFDYREMYLQVTNAVRNWTLFGFPILNNWFCLIVAGGLFALSSASFIAPYFAARARL